jgi:hypothetical protein
MVAIVRCIVQKKEYELKQGKPAFLEKIVGEIPTE